MKGENYFQISFPLSFFKNFLLPKPLDSSSASMTMGSFRVNFGVSPNSSHLPSPQPLLPPGHSLHICRKKFILPTSNSACFIFALDLTCTHLLPSWQLWSRWTSPVSSKRRKLDNPPTYWRLPNPNRCFSSAKVFSRTLQIQRISLLPSHKRRPWIRFWNNRHQSGSGSWPRHQKSEIVLVSFPQ